MTLNGQDYNLDRARCFEQSPSNWIWDDPNDPHYQMPAIINYTDRATFLPRPNSCPFVYYKHPTVLALGPAGAALCSIVGYSSDVSVMN